MRFAQIAKHNFQAKFPEPFRFAFIPDKHPDVRSRRDQMGQGSTGQYLSQNPLPDPSQWDAIADPELSLRTALGEIYAYYGRTEAMMVTTYRDIDSSPILQEFLAPFFDFWRDVRDRLAEKFPTSGETCPLLRAAIGHAIHFLTWHSLVREQELADDQAVELMAAMINCVSFMK